MKAGSESQIVLIQINDSTTGAGKTGMAYDDAGLAAYYIRNTGASSQSITLADMTLGTWASGGFKEVDATHLPGLYQVGIPNAALVAGATEVAICFSGVADCVYTPLKIPLEVKIVSDLNDASSADVEDACDTALSNYGANTVAPLDAAGIRTAVGMASANLDTQLAALPTDADVNAACDTALSDYGANTVVPDVAGTAATLHGITDGKIDAIQVDTTAILADTDDLQTNQGDWATATGFSTHSAADVWAVGTRTLSSFGSLVADIATAIWSAVARTLTAGTKDTEINDIKTKTDQLTFTETLKVDATATATLSAGDIEDIGDAVIAGVVAAPEISRLGEGTGAIDHVYTVLDDDSDPIPDVRVFVYSDVSLETLVARGTTDNFGNITFYLDAGTYYFVSTKAGYTFDNPDTEAVS